MHRLLITLLAILAAKATVAPFPISLGGNSGNTQVVMVDYHSRTQNLAVTGRSYDDDIKGYIDGGSAYNLLVASYQGACAAYAWGKSLNKDTSRYGEQVYFNADGVRIFIFTYNSSPSNNLIAFEASSGTLVISVTYTNSAWSSSDYRPMLMGSAPDYSTYICNWIASSASSSTGLIFLKFNANTDDDFQNDPLWARSTISSSGNEYPLGLVFGDSEDVLYSFSYLPRIGLVLSRTDAADGNEDWSY